VVHIYPRGDTIRCLMATKPRHLKTPVQLWIGDKRKDLGLTPGDIATLTGVSEDTARGWESRGRPSQEAIAILERRFGEPAPADRPEYAADLAEALAALIDELGQMRQEREAWTRGVVAVLRAYGEGRLPQDLLDGLAPPPRESEQPAPRGTEG
jgi:transcriptional regulator with XRE-family HTH domain